MKILQLLPANHWYAKYSNPNGIDHYSKVICFGLIKWTDTEYDLWVKKDITLSEIEGFTVSQDGIDLDIKCNNFEGYIYSPNKNLEFEN